MKKRKPNYAKLYKDLLLTHALMRDRLRLVEKENEMLKKLPLISNSSLTPLFIAVERISQALAESVKALEARRVERG